MFPLLCVAGGALLLTCSHSVFDTQSELLIELSHALPGFLAVIMGARRWLELHLEPPAGRLAGMVCGALA